MLVDHDPQFWEPDLSSIAESIENEVHRAVEEFIMSTDPDTLIYEITADPDNPENVSIDLLIDGRGKKDIHRKFSILDLVDYELEVRTEDGKLVCREEGLEHLRAIAQGLKMAAAKIETALFLKG